MYSTVGLYDAHDETVPDPLQFSSNKFFNQSINVCVRVRACAHDEWPDTWYVLLAKLSILLSIICSLDSIISFCLLLSTHCRPMVNMQLYLETLVVWAHWTVWCGVEFFSIYQLEGIELHYISILVIV